MWAVYIGEAAVEVDHLLTVCLQRKFFDIGHVQSRRIVDGVDADGDGLVRELFTIACTEGHHGFAVHIVVNRFVAEGVASEFNADDFRVGIVHDLEGQRRDVNGLTVVIGVGEVFGECQDTGAAFVNHLNGQTSPARLTVFNHVEQKRAVGEFSGVGVVATIVNLDLNALLSKRTAIIVREQDFEFFGVGMPCNEVIAV